MTNYRSRHATSVWRKRISMVSTRVISFLTLMMLYTLDPGEKSGEWVHPCKCTLVAHQSCLMKVIFRKKLRRRSRIKCPQCQFPYAIERNQKLVFTCLLFEIGDKLVGLAGTVVFIAGAAGVAVIALSGALTAGSAYGSWAVQQYFGDEYV